MIWGLVRKINTSSSFRNVLVSRWCVKTEKLPVHEGLNTARLFRVQCCAERSHISRNILSTQ